MSALIASGKFKTATDTVELLANFNNFGTGSVTKLTSIGNGIYAVTIPNFSIGSNIQYKFGIDGASNGKQEFANSSYMRQYVVLEGAADTVSVTYQPSDPSITGIESLAVPSYNIHVYPVPTSKDITVKYTADFIGTVNYKITDLLGAEKLSSSFISNSNHGQYDISCETLPSGVYLLTVEINGTQEVFKVVMQK
jgi:hypothetical protein